MKRNESKYFHTAELMDQALLLLLESKDYDYISVKEICKKAGVNRSTFYLHYETMNDLLIESINYISNRLFDKYPKNTFDYDKLSSYSLDEIFFLTPKYTIPYLEFIKENKKVFMVIAKKSELFPLNTIFDSLYCDVIGPILGRYNIPESEKKYILAFYLSGLHAILIEWVKNGYEDKVEDIANIMIKCVDTDNLSLKK